MSRYRLRLDLQLFSGEKTEKATPKKQREARGKGQVAFSQEIVQAVSLIVIISLFMALGPYFSVRVQRLFSDVFLHGLNMKVTEANVISMLTRYAVEMFKILAPIFLGVMIVSLAVSYAQIGFLFTTEPLKPKFGNLSPIKGFKRMFGMRSVFELSKSMLKLVAVSIVAYIVLWSAKDRVMAMAHVPVAEVFSFTGGLTVKLTMLVGILMLILAAGDFFYQKFTHEKSLRMSKQDIKDEYKNSEGDPKIKAKIRERQRRMAITRMMQEIPKADVVITNPTHFAVALQYDGTKMDAPRVIAKGQDYLALRIREIAKEHQVVTMENKPLARALYERTEIGDSIPADLFQAVAEVLAYVYRLKGGRRNA